MQEDEYLFTKNKVVFDGKVKDKNIVKEEIKNLAALKPNQKMFGILPVRLGIYNFTFDKKETKFRWWLKNKIGEAPKVYNEDLIKRSRDNFKLYMFNRGYLNSSVSYQSSFGEQKVFTKFTVSAKDVYTINDVVRPTPENEILNLLNLSKRKSLLKVDDNLNFIILDDERKRISDYLREYGYYDFRKDYITYQIDTNQTHNTAKIILDVKAPNDTSWHQKYYINDIYTYVDVSALLQDSSKLDTTFFDGIHFIYNKKRYRENTLASGIFLRKNQVFQLSKYQNTLKKLANYGTFKFVDIRFVPKIIDEKHVLDTYIDLSSAKKQSLSVDVEANHNFIGLTGTSVSFTYQNKNIFKAADLFEFKISTGLQFNVGKKNTPPLNNLDFLVETNYYLNRFLAPFKVKKYSKFSDIKTKFSLQYNFERRILFYSLHNMGFNFGYTWRKNNNIGHQYNPVALNVFILQNKEQSFIDRLNEIPALKRSFEEQFIIGSNYTFTYNNLKSTTDRSYFVFQGKVSSAGNLIHGIVALTKQAKNNTTPYKILNREYSQFARFELNIVHNLRLSKNSSLHSRFNSGVIIPYGNSTIAPYFQQFYVGGANSIRGFKLRALGPGTYADTANITNSNFFFDQAGDFKLEANTELRFGIYKWFKGAVFFDAGNIWLLKKDTARPGGEINKQNFIRGLALSTGLGIRLDFNYFVIRTDFSFPLIDPRYNGENRYPLNNFKFNVGKNSWFRENIIFHLGIGYPF
ncbi:MAG: BamA/TamA family outer membrane protein [Chitinophagales bacterium]|nr:BamA/TamA family outer membrane protein [Chitinophagales bacterium]